MIKKLVLLSILSFCLTTHSQANQLEYVRKAISGPKELWLKPKTTDILVGDRRQFLDETFKKSIEVKRFDFNTLPEYVFNSIFKQLESQDDFNEAQVTTLFDTIVVPEIENILNNPEIQRYRIENQKKDNRKFTFADTKGNAQNVLLEDLNTFYNSSFIYFPYVKEAILIEKQGVIRTKIIGGIIWYQIRDDGDGHKKIVRIKTIEAEGKDEHYLSKGENLDQKREETVQYAIIKWCNELEIATKGLEEFQLSGQIIETKGWKYRVNLGESEGVQLDDAYQIMDYVDKNGIESIQPVGFGMITSIGNRKKEKSLSTLSQQLGKKQTVGSFIKEYPRLSSMAQLSFGKRTGLSLKSSEIDQLKSDSTQGILASVKLSQNLAPYLHISQFFIGTQFDCTLLESSLKKEYSGLPIMVALSIFVEKKYWYRSHALYLNTGVGNERFYLNGTGSDGSYDIMLESSHINFGVGYEKLLNPNLSFTCGIEKRFSAGISNGTLKYNNNDETNSHSFSSDFKNTDFGGTLIRFGLNYIIPATFKLR